ncbi:hypothetical protein KSP40_PGU022336 [Platanthera guangdongensis]|uniref:Uncharacterized protein n=1 Tax=Platanthera guangdongensis TaxID=2320717 RepID=A0ABR2M0F6_9ASPA
MCKCRSHGTFPHFGLQSSHLNICYYHQDPHQRPLPTSSRPEFHSSRRALLLIKVWHLPRWPGVGRALKRHPFSGLVDSADERFARQYRCGPPPEFPLASPRSGIVHHLSGPGTHALTQTLHIRSRSVGSAPRAPFQETWARSVAEDASPDYNSSCMATRFPCWAIPGSLAVTRGILVSFFSSAY